MPDFAFAEFKEMVARFHDAGIEVILDVVYNHTAEGHQLGPTLSFKGIDNASYYRLLPKEPRYYINDTGTGNTLNLSHQRVLQMVTDSLRYWVQEMHVTLPLRSRHRARPRNPRLRRRWRLFRLLPAGSGSFLGEIDRRAVGHRARGYQVGGFSPGWAEWNDRFRDTVSSSWKGDAGRLGDFAACIAWLGRCFRLARPQALGEREFTRLGAQAPARFARGSRCRRGRGDVAGAQRRLRQRPRQGVSDHATQLKRDTLSASAYAVQHRK